MDYRMLNTATKNDVSALPPINDTLDRDRHANFFYSLHLKRSYSQIEADKHNQNLKTFLPADAVYEFQVVLLGLCNGTRIVPSGNGRRPRGYQMADLSSIFRRRGCVLCSLPRTSETLDDGVSGY